MTDLTPNRPRPSTRAAEGLPRWRWRVADVERLAAAGVFGEADRLELVGGELVPMAPKGNFREHVRAELTFHLTRLASAGMRVAAEPQFNLADDEFRNPDILVYPHGIRVHDVRGSDALLVVEIADTSLAHDTGAKAETYARFGVRDYWVVDAMSRATIIFRDPDSATGTFTSRAMVPADQTLQALLVPEIAVKLAELD